LVGPVTYDDRLSVLDSGTGVEQVGAWMMQIDPATVFLADQIGPILRQGGFRLLICSRQAETKKPRILQLHAGLFL